MNRRKFLRAAVAAPAAFCLAKYGLPAAVADTLVIGGHPVPSLQGATIRYLGCAFYDMPARRIRGRGPLYESLEEAIADSRNGDRILVSDTHEGTHIDVMGLDFSSSLVTCSTPLEIL